MTNERSNLRIALEQRVSDAINTLPELEAAVALADWREDGLANTEALAEFLEIPPDAVVRCRHGAREKMLAAARSVVELADWEALCREMVWRRVAKTVGDRPRD